MSAVTKCTLGVPVAGPSVALATCVDAFYNSDGCGICEKDGAEIFWFSPYSRCAHEKCVEKMKDSEASAWSAVTHMFQYVLVTEKSYLDENFVLNIAHIELIKTVRAACGAETLSSYLEKHGGVELQRVYNKAAEEVANASRAIVKRLDGEKKVQESAFDSTIMKALAAVPEISKSDVCGICEQKGAEVFWMNPHSMCAHAKCLETIQALEAPAWSLVTKVFLLVKERTKSTFADKLVLAAAHIELIKTVRAACGSETMSSYLEKHGKVELGNVYTKAVEEVSELALATIRHW